MKRFEGKNVVITGSASGIGQATAQRIAEEGGTLALIDINAEGLNATKQMCEAAGSEGVHVRMQRDRRRRE